MSILVEPSLLQDEVQVFNAIGPDCDNALQLDIANLSDNCRHSSADVGFGFVNGQVSLAWSIAIHIQELYTWQRVLKERWREERTGSSSLNFV